MQVTDQTEHQPIPSPHYIDSSNPGYAAYHAAVYADPRVTDLDTAARYIGETSTDNGRTWQPVPMPTDWDSVCGAHVQVEAASALLAAYDVDADGPVRIVHDWDGSLTRWTPVGMSGDGDHRDDAPASRPGFTSRVTHAALTQARSTLATAERQITRARGNRRWRLIMTIDAARATLRAAGGAV